MLSPAVCKRSYGRDCRGPWCTVPAAYFIGSVVFVFVQQQNRTASESFDHRLHQHIPLRSLRSPRFQTAGDEIGAARTCSGDRRSPIFEGGVLANTYVLNTFVTIPKV